MRTSLIITTYNWKEALELSLRSVLNQQVLPLEVIVADDGSGDETHKVIEAVAADSPIPIIHSWQEDKGFRLARSRNKAIAKAQGEYIILIDGDILLEKHFVCDHHLFAQNNFFVQGTRVLLNERLSNQTVQSGSLEVHFCSHGVENRKNCLRSDLLARLFSLKSNRLSGVRTCNFAFWREDAVRVNGFNEDFVGWGREDSEFTARMMNIGVKRQNVKFNALVYHLYHPINDRANLQENDSILKQTVNKRLSWCEHGLDQYLLSQSERSG
jgi:glycosyltransferase involved in cell wall biosynthesis